MNIELFGINFSSFIKAFKSSYSLGDGTYDFMAFLEDTDCASHCAMIQTFKNPNYILNLFIKPSLDSIIISGGKNKMKGGANQQYIFILMLFLLGVSSVFAGPKYDELVRVFGLDKSKWPKEPGSKPNEPANRWNGFFLTIGPSENAIKKYNDDFAKWTSDTKRYEQFLPMQKEYEIEYGEQQEIIKTELAVKQIKATADLTAQEVELEKTKIGETHALAAYDAYNKLLELSEKNAELRETLGLWKGLAIGGGGCLLGLFFTIVGFMYSRRNRYAPIGYYPANDQGVLIEEIREQQRDAMDRMAMMGYPDQTRRITNRGGKKTKNYRKKRTTKRRH